MIRIVKLICVSLLVMAPIAWIILLVFTGSLGETLGNIFGSLLLPVIIACVSGFYFIKGSIEIGQNKRYSQKITIGVVLLSLSFIYVLFVIQKQFSLG